MCYSLRLYIPNFVDETRVKEFGLKSMWRSPNGTIRNILDVATTTGQDSWKFASALMAIYIGGAISCVAVSEALGVSLSVIELVIGVGYDCNPMVFTRVLGTEEQGCGNCCNIYETCLYKMWMKKYRCEIKEILEMEMKILEALNYYLVVFHPYRALSQLVQDAGMSNATQGLVNDTYNIDLILVHPPHLIGLACVYVASVLKEKENTAWFEDLRVDMNVVKNIAMEILDFYDAHKMITEDRMCLGNHAFSISIGFLDKLLCYDHQDRLTAKEAMQRTTGCGHSGVEKMKIQCLEGKYEKNNAWEISGYFRQTIVRGKSVGISVGNPWEPVSHEVFSLVTISVGNS
ncbi:hypothetical protein LXL04_010417 [Taraxacum kok-saghyz]